jgi:membrane protein DedA with SNARE-associated domain
MELERLIIRHGLLAVFVFAMLEGDLTLILAGVSAHLGLLPLGSAIVVGVLGNFTGDTIWYLLGRLASGVIRGSRPYRRVGPTVERLAQRIGIWQVLAARFIWGTRNASMVFWGSHHMAYPRFAGVDLLGCFLACTLFAGLGFALSGSAEVLIGNVKRVEVWLLGAVVVAAIVVYVVSRLTKRQLGE